MIINHFRISIFSSFYRKFVFFLVSCIRSCCFTIFLFVIFVFVFDNEKFYYAKFTIQVNYDTILRKLYKSHDVRYQSHYSSFVVIKDQSKYLNILDSTFGITKLIDYLEYFEKYVFLHLVNLKGFDINLLGANLNSLFLLQNAFLNRFILVNSEINFYIGKEMIKSCQDFTDKSVSEINSIFQIKNFDKNLVILAINCEFPQKLCPLVFKNSNISVLRINNLANTFFKKNLLQFTNNQFSDLNSNIRYLSIFNPENIDLDTNLVNPSIFENTSVLDVYGYVNSISNDFGQNLKNLLSIEFQIAHVRKMYHKNGIEWIKQFNQNINVNMSDFIRMIKRKINNLFILVYTFNQFYDERISNVFPDEDFCLYKDFQFNQLIYSIQYWEKQDLELVKILNSYLSCTYLWLTQYSDIYIRFYTNTSDQYNSLLMIVESDSFKSILECNFKQRLELCNKSQFQVKEIWGLSDFFILNKKIHIAIKISTYLVSFFGIVTNMAVIAVIVTKKNKELFKKFRQYTFLALNSCFNLLILIIQILSWVNDCFYPYEIFCPEIRKLAAIQFFKIIFKECLLIAFRFMCNFCYIAFALNRISLIGMKHEKLVKFMSSVGIKKYIGVTLLISIGLSAIKFFKYTINYDSDESNFPISNEFDIFNTLIDKTLFLDAFFIVNSISDIINYIASMIICLIIDICMIVKLRAVLEEKKSKSKSLKVSSASKSQQSKDSDEAVSKAIKMVVINTAVNLLFKIPLSFLPTVDVYAQFYNKSQILLYEKPVFKEFYMWLINSGSFAMFEDLSDLFYCFSISIQFFIYKRFDSMFRKGFNVLFKKLDSY